MEKVMCDRKRGKNVSESDKCLLIDIMKTHINSIECKKHDVRMLNKKRNAWKVVTDEFNALSDEKRTEEQLRVLWKDLKAKAKKQKARENYEKFKTGDYSQTKYVDGVSKIIIELMPQMFEEIDPICDDGATIANYENSMKTEVLDGAVVGDLERELSPSLDISVDINPDISMNAYGGSSKHDIGDKDNISRRSSGQESNINYHQEELHKMRLSFLHKEHEEKMSIMQREREMQEEAHALRMDILQSLKNKISLIPIEGPVNFVTYLDKASEVNKILSESSE